MSTLFKHLSFYLLEGNFFILYTFSWIRVRMFCLQEFWWFSVCYDLNSCWKLNIGLQRNIGYLSYYSIEEIWRIGIIIKKIKRRLLCVIMWSYYFVGWDVGFNSKPSPPFHPLDVKFEISLCTTFHTFPIIFFLLPISFPLEHAV